MNITCVKCTSVLDRTRHGDVEVDVCPSCGGLWLDRGEIERLAQAPSTVDALRGAIGGTGAPEIADEAASCPACAGRLKVVTLGKVHVEFCAKCHGMFLEKGELDGALAAISGTTVAQVLSLAARSLPPPLPRD